MTGDDWHDPDLTTFGMFVSGDPLRSPGPHGEQQVDTSFVLWFNAGRAHVPVTLPENDWVEAGEVVLSTDPELPMGTPVKAGETLAAARQSVVVLARLSPAFGRRSGGRTTCRSSPVRRDLHRRWARLVGPSGQRFGRTCRSEFRLIASPAVARARADDLAPPRSARWHRSCGARRGQQVGLRGTTRTV